MGTIIHPISEAIISRHFEEANPHENQKSHIHGGVDLLAPYDTPIIAPEDGFIFGWQAIRSNENLTWPDLPRVHEYKKFSFSNVFYDEFGGVTFLESVDGIRTHLFARSNMTQILNRIFDKKYRFYVEYRDRQNARFPVMCHYTERIRVRKGDIIGYVGNSGYECDKIHCHWEIHNSLNNYQKPEDRINPEELL